MKWIVEEENKMAFLKEQKQYKKFRVFDTYLNEERNASVEKDDNGNLQYVFVYAKGRQKYGRRYNVGSFCSLFNIQEKKTEEDKNAQWHKRIARAKKAINNSGLWVHKLEILDNYDKMTWEDLEKVRADYWKIPFGTKLEETDLYKNWHEKYPFMFYNSDKGELCFKSSDYYEMADLKLKAMYFGKFENEREKQEIAKAIGENRDYSCYHIVSYDVSFEMKVSGNVKKAWYSEEYRHCGNGHYYIALDENTAWFCEDD